MRLQNHSSRIDQSPNWLCMLSEWNSVTSRCILHVTSWEVAFLFMPGWRTWTLKSVQAPSCTASQFEAVVWTINATDLRPIQQGTYVHITSDIYRIPQMLSAPACLHAGKRSNKERSQFVIYDNTTTVEVWRKAAMCPKFYAWML